MRIVQVKYTVRTTGSDGKTVSENKERILSELESIEPEYIRQVLDQVVRASGIRPKNHSTIAPEAM